ncbi:hypothetical protein POY60_17655, partial [Phocaeicola vulgatus]|nr:hypothetical protein [Phocaeicola vulgatus]
LYLSIGVSEGNALTNTDATTTNKQFIINKLWQKMRAFSRPTFYCFLPCSNKFLQMNPFLPVTDYF